MPTVTKSFTSKIRGIGVSSDGKTVNVSVSWEDAAATDPRQVVLPNIISLRVAVGKVSVRNVELGASPAGMDKLGADLAAAVKELVSALVAAGKIAP
jgi:hypothetical protein